MPSRDAEAIAPLLILLPGLDGSGLLFEPLCKALAGRLDCQVLGYPTVAPQDYDSLVAWAEQQLPKDRPFILLGESFSGPVALKLALRRPPGLRALVLACSFAHRPRPGIALLEPLIRRMPLDAVPGWLLRFALLGTDAPASTLSALRHSLSLAPPACLASRLRAVATVDLRAHLGELQVPLLYLQARQDRLVPARAAQAMARRTRAFGLVRLDGPHALLQAHPLASAEAIVAFSRLHLGVN
ncbi:alpha/beta fold hydrolase [Metapseudomonas otitidis]|uniref:alpha/beta fold hydrolase n=1 Tax=Metapseudomonas otitidis TaxID=319939 RepID=UPI003216FCE8